MEPMGTFIPGDLVVWTAITRTLNVCGKNRHDVDTMVNIKRNDIMLVLEDPFIDVSPSTGLKYCLHLRSNYVILVYDGEVRLLVRGELL